MTFGRVELGRVSPLGEYCSQDKEPHDISRTVPAKEVLAYCNGVAQGDEPHLLTSVSPWAAQDTSRFAFLQGLDLTAHTSLLTRLA